jgi:hypothetical protein
MIRGRERGGYGRIWYQGIGIATDKLRGDAAASLAGRVSP